MENEMRRYKYNPPERTCTIRPDKPTPYGENRWYCGLSTYYCFCGGAELARRLSTASGVRWRYISSFMDSAAFYTQQQPPKEFEVTIPWTEPSAEWVAATNRARGKIAKSRNRGRLLYIVRGGYVGGVVGRFDTEDEARAYIEAAKRKLEEAQ